MKKMILLFVINFLCLNTSSFALLAKAGQLRSIPWEVMGASRDGFLLTRIERLRTPDGWIVKIITMEDTASSNHLDSIQYLTMPDSRHEWSFDTKRHWYSKFF